MRTRRKARVAWEEYFPTEVVKPTAACQCEDPFLKRPCKKTPVKGTVFCKDHQGCPGSPQSGSEPSWEPDADVYGKQPVQGSHNCYSWAMRHYDPMAVELCKKNGSCRRYFPQPGALHGDRNALNVSERRTCKMVEHLQKTDNPAIQKVSFYQQCPKNMSKIALVVDPGEDYHYYSQDNDGWWSHKDGSNKPKRYDALKLPIFNPKLAARDYRWQDSDLNYEDFCGFYCVPRDGSVKLGRGGSSAAKQAKRAKSRRVAKQAKKRRTRRLVRR